MAAEGYRWLCCLFVIVSLGLVTHADDCGDLREDWHIIENFQIEGYKVWDEEMVGVNVEECKDLCIEHNEESGESDEGYEKCRSIEFFEGDHCNLNYKHHDDEGVTYINTPGVTYYKLLCDDDDGFLETLQDNPEYAALVGLGAVIIILIILAIVIICVMSPQYGKK